MKNTINFGIDLGTTNSAIARYTEGEVEIFRNPVTLKQTLASVVAFRNNRIIVGEKARELLQKDPQNVVGTFKRKMGTADQFLIQSTRESIGAEELSAFVLKELKNFIHTGEPLDAAVITIPAAFDTMQSNATKKAGYRAGFRQVVLLQEPIAASLAFANKNAQDLVGAKWLVYDLGGGTFDVALVTIEKEEMKVLDHEGNNYLGGADFDQAIVEKVMIPHLEKIGRFGNLEQEMKSAAGKYNRLYNLLLFKAEEAKIGLTNAAETEIEFETEDDEGNLLDVYLTLSKEQFNAVLRPFIDKTVRMVENIFSRNRLNKEDIRFILMVGGSTYIPAVREQLAEHFQVDINCNIDPTTAVAVGAAYYAGMKMRSTETQTAEGTSPGQKSPDLDIKLAFSKVAQELESPLIGQVKGDMSGKYYRVIRQDGGFDSGLKPLTPDFVEYLSLGPNLFNQFTFKVFDALNNPVRVEVPSIGITHGRFSIDGQPLPNDICLEVDAPEKQTTFLEPVFRKNAVLPLKKTIVKQVSKPIPKGSDEELLINVVEGPVETLPSANKTIGHIRISGRDLNRDLIPGSDVELTLEISESRDLTVQVYLSLTGQEFENVFSPSEMNVELKHIREELRAFHINVLKKREETAGKEEFHRAASLTALLTKIEALQQKADLLQADDVTDDKYQLDEAKRGIAAEVHAIYNKSILQKALENYFSAKNKVVHALLSADAGPEDRKRFEDGLRNEEEVIQSQNIALIEMKTSVLDSISHGIYTRRPFTNGDLISSFSYYKNLHYRDVQKATTLIDNGNKALDKGNFAGLSEVIHDLYYLHKKEEGDDPDMFKKTGTGLR